MRHTLFLCCLICVSSLNNGFPRPPLGWSALYGAPFSTVNETIVRIAAQGLVDGGFAAAGYEYVNLDDWYATRDSNGTIIAIPSSWPSGMRSTSDFVHSLNLKFGVYSAASQRTCGNYSASQFLEEQDATTFASDWQIDYLKYDSCIYQNGVQAPRARYVTMRDALNKTGRKIFFSMEGNLFDPSVGNAWRIGGDIWPRFSYHLSPSQAPRAAFLPLHAAVCSFCESSFARLQVPTRMSDVQRPFSSSVWRFISSARSFAGCGR